MMWHTTLLACQLGGQRELREECFTVTRGLVSTTMQNEARRLRAERWKAENQEGMAEVARFIEMNGSFADENRDW